MLTDLEIRLRIKQLDCKIYEELDNGTDDPVRQWAALKCYHAQKIAYEDVLR